MYLAKSLADKLYLFQVIFSFVALNVDKYFVSSLCVQVSPESHTNHLFCVFCTQYPVRPSTMTYDDVNHLAAKIKPKQQRVK